MKNNIFAFIVALFLTVTPQLALSDEGKPAEGSDSSDTGSESGGSESGGSAAGSAASGSAIGGISLGTIAAVAAIAAVDRYTAEQAATKIKVEYEILQAHNGSGIYGLIELRAAGNAMISAVLDGRTGLQVLAVAAQDGEGSGRE